MKRKNNVDDVVEMFSFIVAVSVIAIVLAIVGLNLHASQHKVDGKVTIYCNLRDSIDSSLDPNIIEGKLYELDKHIEGEKGFEEFRTEIATTISMCNYMKELERRGDNRYLTELKSFKEMTQEMEYIYIPESYLYKMYGEMEYIAYGFIMIVLLIAEILLISYIGMGVLNLVEEIRTIKKEKAGSSKEKVAS